MNFRRPKNEVISNANIAAMNAIQIRFNNLQYSQMSTVKDTVAYAMSEGIRAAIESLVNDTYTDEEFESDIGLKP